MPTGTFSSDQIVTAAPEQLSSKLGAETVILSMNSGVYYGLNPVGARVWELAQNRGSSIAIIRQSLVTEFDVTSSVAEQDLSELLSEMQSEGLIRISKPN